MDSKYIMKINNSCLSVTSRICLFHTVWRDTHKNPDIVRTVQWPVSRLKKSFFFVHFKFSTVFSLLFDMHQLWLFSYSFHVLRREHLSVSEPYRRLLDYHHSRLYILYKRKTIIIFFCEIDTHSITFPSCSEKALTGFKLGWTIDRSKQLGA